MPASSRASVPWRGSAKRSAVKASTASFTSPRPCRASAKPTSTSACAPTSTRRAPCSTACVRRRTVARRRRASSSRARSRCSTRPVGAAPRARRRHTLPARRLLRHAKLLCEHLIATTRARASRRPFARLMTSRCVRAARTAPLLFFSGIVARAARGRRGDLPVSPDVSHTLDVAVAHRRRPDRDLRPHRAARRPPGV